MVICPEASSAQNSMAAVSAQGSALVSSLDPALELLVRNRSIAFEVRIDFHYWREPRECEQPVAGFLQAVGDGAAFEATICG